MRVNKPTPKQCEELWKKCIKERAGWRSEYSGKSGEPMHPHHIMGKPNHRLRFELDNGICITGGEHHFIAHHTGRSADFREKACKIRGTSEDHLKQLGRQTGGVDLWAVWIYLTKKLKEFTVLNSTASGPLESSMPY